MIMSFLQVVEKAVMKTVCKDFKEACGCPDSCVGTLNLEGITDFKFKKTILSMPKRTFVKKLNLSKLNFENENFFACTILGGTFPELQHLNLSNTNITNHALRCTIFMPLKFLDLSGCRSVTSGDLAFFHQMEHLTELHLTFCSNITNAVLPHLTHLPLETLWLPFLLTDADIQHLPITLKEIPHLSDEITDACLVQLARLTSLSSLELCEYNLITDAGLRHLAHLKLTFLFLTACNNITDEGIKYLSHMPLKFLSLSYSNITDRGLAYLARLRLENLKLDWCTQITDAGIKHLSDMPLEKLVLRGCNRLTDFSMQVIGGMLLEHLDLSGCERITSDALLWHIPNMRLRVLRVGGLSFTPLHAMQLTRSAAPTHVDYSDTNEWATDSDDDSEDEM
jgi:hypothetical protein